MLFMRYCRWRACYQLLCLPALVVLMQYHCKAQPKTGDTVLLTLPEAEKIFLEKNLSLLAQHYNIDINKALVQQARYWDNPVLNTDQNIYDGKFFRHDSQYGQIFIQVTQLIKTAGKRNKLIRLSNDQVLTAEQQFNDLMRNLKYLLRNDFAALYQLLQTNRIYDTELGSLDQLVKGMDAQLQAGNISQKENLRLKALQYSLQSDKADLQRQIADLQSDLHVLLQDSTGRFINASMPETADTAGIEQLSLQQLLDSARANRPDIRLAQTNLSLQQHNLSYQKALAVPDFNVGVEYDQRSSYINNYYGLAISLPIPLLNRNKGNIRAAEFSIRQAETGIQQAQSQAEQEVIGAYNKLLTVYRLKQHTSPDLQSRYDQLLHNMLQSYQQRQVGLLEFLDFFGSYKDARLKQLQQETNLRSAMEEINLATGKDILH